MGRNPSYPSLSLLATSLVEHFSHDGHYSLTITTSMAKEKMGIGPAGERREDV
jgi:hypothetical protein